MKPDTSVTNSSVFKTEAKVPLICLSSNFDVLVHVVGFLTNQVTLMQTARKCGGHFSILRFITLTSCLTLYVEMFAHTGQKV